MFGIGMTELLVVLVVALLVLGGGLIVSARGEHDCDHSCGGGSETEWNGTRLALGISSAVLGLGIGIPLVTLGDKSRIAVRER